MCVYIYICIYILAVDAMNDIRDACEDYYY